MATAALSDDAFAMDSNPAGMAQNPRVQFGSQAGALPLGRDSTYLSALAPLESGSDWHLGLSWTQYRLADGVEARTKNTPDPDSILAASDNVFQVGFALALPGPAPRSLFVGTAFKFVQDYLGDNSSSGFGLDLGFLARLDRGIRAGVVLRDSYTTATWNSGSSEQAPLAIRAGMSWRPEGWPLCLAAELEKGAAQGPKPRLGAEWETLEGLAQLRLGFNNGSPCAGLGLRVLKLEHFWARLDYAATADRAMDNALDGLGHRVSLSCDYTLPPPPPPERPARARRRK